MNRIHAFRNFFVVLLLTGAFYVLTTVTLTQHNPDNNSYSVRPSLNSKTRNRNGTKNVAKEKFVQPPILEIAYVGNSFAVSETKGEETSRKYDNLLVLEYRMSGHPHTGITLPSVRDELTGRSCTYTTRMNLYNKSDVVIVPGRAMETELPAYRPDGQRWIFYTSESFHYVKPDIRYRHAFNHTMTYHSHADIYAPKCALVPQQNATKTNTIRSKIKGKIAVWMASHCGTQSKRDNFVKELSRYIPVDTYGKCGQKSCPKEGWCYDILSRYKFYVAIENSLCNGYITEKPWVGFLLGTVPIVGGAGAEAYRRILPPNSYIDLDTFTSAKDVADYLKLVARNDTLYRQYFAWRENYDFGVVSKSDLAGTTCEYLHQTKNNGPHQVDLMEFSSDNNAICNDAKNISWLSGFHAKLLM